MFLYQKFNYDYKHIDLEDKKNAVRELGEFLKLALSEDTKYICYDTETTGLSIIKDKPFLVSIGFNKHVVTLDYDKEVMTAFFKMYMLGNFQSKPGFLGLIAHNGKYDYHMLDNGGSTIPEDVRLYDSITIARLTEYTDERESMSLENLGIKYVDDEAKFAGKVIKKHVAEINLRRRNAVKVLLKEKYGKEFVKPIMEAYDDRNEYIDSKYSEELKFIDENYKEANYQDSYIENPNIMRSYAADDIVIMLEYLKKSMVTLYKVDKDLQVFTREGQLIRVIAELEKNGFLIDTDYVLKCRENIVKYRDMLYNELYIYTDVEFSVGQHKLIMKILKDKFNVNLVTCDEKALKLVIKVGGLPKEIASNILELRTIDKWLSTYVDGKLGQLVNGRLHTNINNSGAVSGRVSCDLQQQPKDALLDRDGNELFHPRKMFICDPGTKLYFIDESQMELRVQAYYTILTASEPDLNLCRAYMPYSCYKISEANLIYKFDYTDKASLKNFEKFKWYTSEGNGEWSPTDLHSETTRHAFPSLDPESDEFKKHRKLGKRANFLKIYQGGVQALQESLEIDRATAEALDSAFYKAFPRVKDYQDWVSNQLTLYGFVENLYGRRYYMDDGRQFYKGCNYLIQGSCADMVKTFEINIHNYLKKNKLKTKMLLPVHDEIVFSVPEGEEYIIKDLKAIMEDTYDVIKNVPMVAEVEYSTTNWKEKLKWKDGV